MAELMVLCPGGPPPKRLSQALDMALEGRQRRTLTQLEGPLENARILFVIPLPESGVNQGFYELLAFLRTHPGCLMGCVGGVVVDGTGDFYTKAAARELVLWANLAGCAFPGHPLVEATGSLGNFTVQACNRGCSLAEAYCLAVGELAERVQTFAPLRHRRPKLLVLHASNHATSNTLALWSQVRGQVEGLCHITECCLRNGTLEDCSGCPYTMCLHFGEQGGCFYGGVMVQEVYPALREADAVVLLCPNYNDALSANLTACINRLTALYRAVSFTDKAVFAIVVSGYSGGDIVASQVLGALSMNKGFWLPPQALLLETANDAGTALALPGIQDRLADFGAGLRQALCAVHQTARNDHADEKHR